jgi:uncharacterized protein (DUF1015 family)
MQATPIVRPFAALRPAREHAADVVAPPYDVVSGSEARSLAAGKPHSFLHISRPEIDLPPGTSPYADEAYARGAANLERLVANGVLVRDPAPAYYVYRMSMDGRAQTGVALAASVGAYDANRIRRHELTRPDKENDRVRNIAALNAQTGPVLLAYRADAELAAVVSEAANAAPLFEVQGPNDVVHTVWRAAERSVVSRIDAAFARLGVLYIADGHHRSAAASRVAASRRNGRVPSGAAASSAANASSTGAASSAEYFLAVAFPHDEMRILDYNRVVRDLNGLSLDELLGRLAEKFEVERVAAAYAPPAPRSFGLFAAGHWHALTIRDRFVPAHDPVASLDVSLLQDHVLAPLLGIGDPRTDARIDFVGGIRGLAELERRVASGDAAVAFALHPTRMVELMSVADAERLMPPKSTWFEPKLADGLLTHVLD